MALPVIGSGTYLAQYDASTLGLADGAAVSSWADGTGNGNTATQATGVKQPVFKTGILNGQSVVRFDGVSDSLSTAPFALPATYTIFAVAKANGGGAALPQSILDSDNAPTFRYFQFIFADVAAVDSLQFAPFNTAVAASQDAAPAIVTNFNYLTGRLDTTTVETWVNGASDGSTAFTGTGKSGTTFLSIGALASGSSSQMLNGDVGEIIFVSGALDTTDRPAVEAYLAAKWLTPAPDGAYPRDFAQHTIGPF